MCGRPFVLKGCGMGLETLFANAGALMVEAFAAGDTVSYLHKATGERLDLPGYYKSRMIARDPIGGQTEYQDVPRFRISWIPWPEKTLAGDEITDKHGNRWHVTNGNIPPSGAATIHVKLIGHV